jgi:hypothetical protein
MIGLIALNTSYSKLQVTTALSLIYTLYSSLLHTHTLRFSVFISCILATDFNSVTIPVLLNYTL